MGDSHEIDIGAYLATAAAYFPRASVHHQRAVARSFALAFGGLYVAEDGTLCVGAPTAAQNALEKTREPLVNPNTPEGHALIDAIIDMVEAVDVREAQARDAGKQADVEVRPKRGRKSRRDRSKLTADQQPEVDARVEDEPAPMKRSDGPRRPIHVSLDLSFPGGAGYVRYRRPPSGEHVARTQPLSDDVNVDYDASGDVLGIEMLAFDETSLGIAKGFAESYGLVFPPNLAGAIVPD